MVSIDANNPSHSGANFDINTSNVTVTSVYEIKAVEEFKVFPNPATDRINVQVELKENADLQMRLTNLTGQVVQEQNVQFITGENTMNVDIQELPRGVYFLSFQSGTQMMTYRVIKQ